jgi:hypothetical protein
MNNFKKKMRDIKNLNWEKKNGAPTNWENEYEIKSERSGLYSFIFKNLLSFIFLTPYLNPHHEIIINLIMPQASAYF